MKTHRSAPEDVSKLPISLLDPAFRYTPSAATDITRTWKRFGWSPVDSRKQAQMKAKLNNG